MHFGVIRQRIDVLWLNKCKNIRGRVCCLGKQSSLRLYRRCTKLGTLIAQTFQNDFKALCMENENPNQLLQAHLTELLRGGFAPVVILLREFHFDKAGIVLDGLPFSAYSLLEHMRHRQRVLLQFMQNPESDRDTWPDAYWPESPVPESEEAWIQAIAAFEQELEEMMQLVQHPETKLFQVNGNGKTICWAAMTTFHHNAYTIGQIKAIGRQLGVW